MFSKPSMLADLMINLTCIPGKRKKVIAFEFSQKFSIKLDETFVSIKGNQLTVIRTLDNPCMIVSVRHQ